LDPFLNKVGPCSDPPTAKGVGQLALSSVQQWAYPLENHAAYLSGGDCRHQACPLRLGRAEAKGCPCKTWEKVGEVQQKGQWQPIRVRARLSPETWNGDTIRNPEAFSGYLRRKSQG
jgi:hypothetical protein